MKNNIYGSGFVLYACLAVATSIAAPRQISAGVPSVNVLIASAQQSGDPGGGQQPPSPRPPREGGGGPGNGRPPLHSRPPQNGGENAPGRPPRPNPAPNPPSPPTTGPVNPPGNPTPGPGRPPVPPRSPVRPPRPTRPPMYHYPPYGPRPGFIWGGGNGWRLHQFFLGDMRRINPIHRHHLYIGGYFPFIYLEHIQPVPADLMIYLPPVPPGYEIGYFDGYCFIYEPHTLMIVSLIDLFRY